MLDMMPGSLVDKTNNNLSTLVCVPTNIMQQKENIMSADLPPSTTTKPNVVETPQEVPSYNTPNNNNVNNTNSIASVSSINRSQSPSTSSLNLKTHKKLSKILKKYKITEKDLATKLKNIKRHTKDRQKPNRVLSLKLKRYSFKTLKPRWSKYQLKNKEGHSVEYSGEEFLEVTESDEESNGSAERDYKDITQPVAESSQMHQDTKEATEKFNTRNEIQSMEVYSSCQNKGKITEEPVVEKKSETSREIECQNVEEADEKPCIEKKSETSREIEYQDVEKANEKPCIENKIQLTEDCSGNSYEVNDRETKERIEDSDSEKGVQIPKDSGRLTDREYQCTGKENEELNSKNKIQLIKTNYQDSGEETVDSGTTDRIELVEEYQARKVGEAKHQDTEEGTEESDVEVGSEVEKCHTRKSDEGNCQDSDEETEDSDTVNTSQLMKEFQTGKLDKADLQDAMESTEETDTENGSEIEKEFHDRKLEESDAENTSELTNENYSLKLDETDHQDAEEGTEESNREEWSILMENNSVKLSETNSQDLDENAEECNTEDKNELVEECHAGKLGEANHQNLDENPEESETQNSKESTEESDTDDRSELENIFHTERLNEIERQDAAEGAVESDSEDISERVEKYHAEELDEVDQDTEKETEVSDIEDERGQVNESHVGNLYAENHQGSEESTEDRRKLAKESLTGELSEENQDLEGNSEESDTDDKNKLMEESHAENVSKTNCQGSEESTEESNIENISELVDEVGHQDVEESTEESNTEDMSELSEKCSAGKLEEANNEDAEEGIEESDSEDRSEILEGNNNIKLSEADQQDVYESTEDSDIEKGREVMEISHTRKLDETNHEDTEDTTEREEENHIDNLSEVNHQDADEEELEESDAENKTELEGKEFDEENSAQITENLNAKNLHETNYKDNREQTEVVESKNNAQLVVEPLTKNSTEGNCQDIEMLGPENKIQSLENSSFKYSTERDYENTKEASEDDDQKVLEEPVNKTKSVKELSSRWSTDEKCHCTEGALEELNTKKDCQGKSNVENETLSSERTTQNLHEIESKTNYQNMEELTEGFDADNKNEPLKEYPTDSSETKYENTKEAAKEFDAESGIQSVEKSSVRNSVEKEYQDTEDSAKECFVENSAEEDYQNMEDVTEKLDAENEVRSREECFAANSNEEYAERIHEDRNVHVKAQYVEECPAETFDETNFHNVKEGNKKSSSKNSIQLAENPSKHLFGYINEENENLRTKLHDVVNKFRSETMDVGNCLDTNNLLENINEAEEHSSDSDFQDWSETDKEITAENSEAADCLNENTDDEESEIEASNNLLPFNYKTDDDIRNKIRQQLELLRKNKKRVVRHIESPKSQQANTARDTAKKKKVMSVPAHLSDVLLSNEGDLSIVSVVGGYVSDEDSQPALQSEEKNLVKSETSSVQNICSSNNNRKRTVGRGTSITDILLKRELNSGDNNSYLIKPKKTNDITKIKGWRSKHFTLAENTSKVVVSEVKLKEESTEKDLELKPEQEKYISSSVENPVPSTSSYIFSTECKTAAVEIKTDNILKQGENTTTENTKSAFVSDMLDSFLTNHSELKISYEVPKLVAEEAITKPQSVMPVTTNDYQSVVNKGGYKSKYGKKNTMKPKTLAEKRRMMEQDRQNQLLHDMETNECVFLKQLEYCEKRNKNEIAKDIRENLVAEETPFSRHCWILATKSDDEARQFAVINGKKIRITGSYGGKDVVITHESKNASQSVSENESLFSRGCMLNNYSKPMLIRAALKRPVQYKPGPLSKKQKLMKDIQSADNWECHVLKMPKIKLVLFPEEGKQLPMIAEKYLQLCRSEEGHISNTWAKFAVSAVRCKEKVPKEKTRTKIEFELPYANAQNKLLVRKRVNTTRCIENTKGTSRVPSIEFPGISVDSDIKDIMSDMLKCIENQELNQKIIKDDPDLECLKRKRDDCVERPPSPINSMVQAIIKRRNVKRSKTTLELRRLNVKVIEVDVKEEETETENCMKDYCRLGCICKSLRGTSGVVPEHCGRSECMLNCTCSFGSFQKGHHSITLPAGTDLLSASTVVRLQDEVKRNLARVEREFTQTVIKANNQTIMVGGGVRERQRRVPKVPKKYSNYVQKNRGLSYDKMISNGLLEDVVDQDFNQREMEALRSRTKAEDVKLPVIEQKKLVPIWPKKEKPRPVTTTAKVCRITLEKLNLENVVPWCMIHNLYKCYCGGKALPQASDVASASIKVKNEEDDVVKEKIEEEENVKEYIPYAPRFVNRYQPEFGSGMIVTDVTEKYCARTRALATNYYQARNKSQSFKARFAKMKEEEKRNKVDFNALISVENTVEENSSVQKAQSEPEAKDELSRQKRNSSDDEIQEYLTTVRPKKITLVNMEDILNPPKTAPVEAAPNRENTCHVVSAAQFIDYDRSFFGILTPSQEWLKRFSKMLNLNMNTIIHQIRLLEWATLVQRQKSGGLQVWFNNKKYNNIILTEDRKRPSRTHMNIKLFENTPLDKFKVPDIIMSLFSNKLPGAATKDNETYVILVYNGMFWEARGTIVLNETSDLCKQRLGYKPTPPNILDPYLQSADYSRYFSEKSPPALVIRSTPSMSVELVNKVKNSRASKSSENTLEISKMSQKNNPLDNILKLNEMQKKQTNILAPLPTGAGMSRWFMLILENDFSVLKISFSNFHIKYTHLTTAIQMARKNKKTVRIRSQDKNSGDSSLGTFGIYAVPDYTDRIFFGPYDKDADHGLETFRYVNGKLVNTKIYNKMRGNTERKTTGIWFTHNSTSNNNLHLEPQFEDSYSSSSECSTEVTSVEHAVKPQIEFVDLTENDSDNEGEKAAQPPIDPLFNVLSADFTKKVTGDITIEPVYNSKNKSTKLTKSVLPNPAGDVAKVTKIPNSSTTASNSTPPIQRQDRKRRSVPEASQEPTKKQPMLIDTINLDLDDDEHQNERRNNDSGSVSVANNAKQIPALCPINTMRNLINFEIAKGKRNATYVITNIPGIGYFELLFHMNKYYVNTNINVNKKLPAFKSVVLAVNWLQKIFQRTIFFMPSTLTIKFSILKSSEPPEMPKFNETSLNGYHMICEKGIFDLLRLNAKEMNDLGFNEYDTSSLLAHKCQLLINRNVRAFGNHPTTDESSNTEKNGVANVTLHKQKATDTKDSPLVSDKIVVRTKQQELMSTINSILKDVPDAVRILTKQKICSMIRKSCNSSLPGFYDVIAENWNKSGTALTSDSGNKLIAVSQEGSGQSLPAGKLCKIVDGKIIVMDQSSNTGAEVTITKSPVTQKNVTKPYPVNLLSAATMQSMIQSAKCAKKTKQYEMVVPIAGLETPVTVVGVTPQQKTTPTSLLLSNQNVSVSRVVDLTDE